jgi:trehalose 6-phosphate synthase
LGRLVVVSNRIADPRKTAAGGLAVALAEVLNTTGGLWFGWSGKIVDHSEDDDVRIQQAGPVKLAMVTCPGGPRRLLPRLFERRAVAGVPLPAGPRRFDAGYITGYRRVNQLFARKLLPLLRPDDVIWVHDYHLIPLAAELRALGCAQRIGFFLHIPLPPPLILAAIPGHDWLIRALFAYDLVGFQSKADLHHFAGYVETEAHAQPLGDDRWRAVRPHGACRRLPDRHRRAGVRRTRAQQGRRGDVRAHEARVLPAQAAGRRGPPRLFQGPAAAHARLPRVP